MIEKKGKEYAESRALSWQLQELRKVVLAEETKKQSDGSYVEREGKARCTEAYKQHLQGTKEAIHRENALKAEVERWSAQFEALRSLLSLEKSKMNIV